MILLDTNVLIEVLKGNQSTVEVIENCMQDMAVSSIAVMELRYGAKDNNEKQQINKFLDLFTVIHIDDNISKCACDLIEKYAKSHSLDIPDSLIAATAIQNDIILMTYNIKDFKYIENIKLFDWKSK